MKNLEKNFEDRNDLIEYVKSLAPWLDGEASNIIGGNKQAHSKLNKIDPINYGATRNFGTGKVTKLSPYIHHGILSLNEVRDYSIDQSSQPEQIKKFIQELGWRDFWQRVAYENPQWVWQDAESYKTGFEANDYADDLPTDILEGKTDVACINSFIKDLIQTGYVHNHARMYIASYVVHFRRVKWQAGARWFLEHLLDGDEASNNFSWQWVASTFSNKPYIFNLENVDKYFGDSVDTSAKVNQTINSSYDELNIRLFPNIKKQDD